MTPTPSRDEILACPFCGNAPHVENAAPIGGAAMIYCRSDECLGPSTTAATLQDAMVQWNTRLAVSASDGVQKEAPLAKPGSSGVDRSVSETAPGQMLCKMIRLATERHAGQFDKGGRPYILHPLTVMHRLRTDDEELQCIAVGHDLVEDTHTYPQELEALGFSTRVIAGIMALTKIPSEDAPTYRARVKENPDAVRVKIEDLRHNSDIRRLKGATEKDVARMVRYHEFYLELKAVAETQRTESAESTPPAVFSDPVCQPPESGER